MESVQNIMKELEAMGSAQTIKIFANHGAPVNNMFGVKVGDMKKIVKRIKKDYELAKGLYDTGNSDAMYLAGLIGDEKKMTKADLNKWAKNSSWYMISQHTVPFVAAESPLGWDLALEWIKSDKENIAVCGWSTLGSVLSILPDEQLDFKKIIELLKVVEKEVHHAQNRVRYAMNIFVISVGTYVVDLHQKAMEVAKKIGKVNVNVGNTACNVPLAYEYIQKIASMNRVGKKRKTARC